MACMAWVVVALPPARDWPGQAAYEFVFGNSWRIVIASMTAFWVGEFANSYVLARMKLWTEGRHLWMRTIGSTIVGQGLDSLISVSYTHLDVYKRQGRHRRTHHRSTASSN